MQSMLTAETAILVQFKLAGCMELVFLRIIIALFAHAASQYQLISSTRFGHGSPPKITCLWACLRTDTYLPGQQKKAARRQAL